MKQNIYDNPDFFAGYATLREKESGLNAVLEQPAITSLLPLLTGKTVLDLGCGFGHFCRAARVAGAAEVWGIDISSRMLKVARETTTDPHIHYFQCALEDYSHAGSPVQVVSSSLMFHYIENIAPLFKKIFDWLTPGGVFVFSVEHPFMTASMRNWITLPDDTVESWPISRYHDEGERRQRWFVENVIKYHRTVSTYLNGMVEAGFVIDRLLEPEARPAAVQARPDLARYHHCPPFLLVRAHKS